MISHGLKHTHFLKTQVGNALEELLQWHSEKMKNNPNIIHATERCAAGIIQAIGSLCLGPNVSPRDIRDLQKCKVEIVNPGYEVVKFYLLYERWRRAEVYKSEQHMQNLKSIFVSSTFFSRPKKKKKNRRITCTWNLLACL